MASGPNTAYQAPRSQAPGKMGPARCSALKGDKKGGTDLRPLKGQALSAACSRLPDLSEKNSAVLHRRQERESGGDAAN